MAKELTTGPAGLDRYGIWGFKLPAADAAVALADSVVSGLFAHLRIDATSPHRITYQPSGLGKVDQSDGIASTSKGQSPTCGEKQ
ncbi:unnamed protein product, partial [Rhizoctonia solani]